MGCDVLLDTNISPTSITEARPRPRDQLTMFPIGTAQLTKPRPLLLRIPISGLSHGQRLRELVGPPSLFRFAFLTHVCRVLHYSSFTPFIVIFLHAIAVTSFEDVQLLEDVVKILRSMRSASKGSERLYQICATFSHLARRLVEDRLSCVGTYNQQDNSLLFLDSQGQMPLSGSEIVHDSLGMDLEEYLVDWKGRTCQPS